MEVLGAIIILGVVVAFIIIGLQALYYIGLTAIVLIVIVLLFQEETQSRIRTQTPSTQTSSLVSSRIKIANTFNNKKDFRSANMYYRQAFYVRSADEQSKIYSAGGAIVTYYMLNEYDNMIVWERKLYEISPTDEWLIKWRKNRKLETRFSNTK